MIVSYRMGNKRMVFSGPKTKKAYMPKKILEE